MKVFISWSGELSKEIGEIFSKWIPSVLQSVRPYFTPEGIEKGSRWSTEIAKELEDSQIGIIMLTRENLVEPWIMFEAGALSKELDRSKICPILFDVKNSDLVGPLVQFQATSFSKEEMKKLVKSINNACSENKLEDRVVDNVFEKWWPDLEEQVRLAMEKKRDGGDRKSRSDRELLEEVLNLSRASMPGIHVEPREYLSPEKIDELYIAFRELKSVIKSNDMTKIDIACKEFEKYMDYILSSREVMERARDEWRKEFEKERETKKRFSAWLDE